MMFYVNLTHLTHVQLLTLLLALNTRLINVIVSVNFLVAVVVVVFFVDDADVVYIDVNQVDDPCMNLNIPVVALN